jgi:glycosyltransferase involved in cell wall biosynthesis
MARPIIGIIIPVRNEQETIKKIVKSLYKFGDIIIVNDASNDKTLEIIKKLKVKIINNKFSAGYERTITKGIKYCYKKKYSYIATIDGDDQHDPNFFKNVKKIKKFDLLIAKRNKFNRLSEYFFSLFSSIILKIKDPLSGMKVYNYEMLKKVKNFNSYNTLNTFLIYKLKKKSKKFYEIKSKIKERKDKSRIGNIFLGEFLVLKSLIKLIVLILLNKMKLLKI